MLKVSENMSSPGFPSVSVIIPCYNHAHYLPQAVDSALAQTLCTPEVIVVDDGSTDDTPNVAAGYSTKIRYIRQANQGLSGARNTGIREARGRLIAFLDADDLWCPDFLATLMPLLDSDPKIGAAYGACQYVDKDGKQLAQITMRVVPPDRLWDTLVDGNIFPPHVWLLRRRCFERVGLFSEDLRASEDWDMWLRITLQYRVVGTSHVVAHYRMHGNNMSGSLDRMHDSQMAVAAKHFGPAEGDPALWPDTKRRVYGGIFLRRALAHCRKREWDLGQQYAQEMLLISPASATSLDVFYTLGCADQPVGSQGDLHHLNLEQNAAWLLRTLAVTFDGDNVPVQLMAYRNVAYSTAYFALGLLAYGSGRPWQARRWLAAASWHNPKLMANIQWLTSAARALIGRTTVCTWGGVLPSSQSKLSTKGKK